MKFLREKFASAPDYPRVAPFAIFVLLTALQAEVGEGSPYPYILYLLKTVVGAWLLWEVRPFVAELRWAFSWEAVVAGVVVFAAWVGLDGFYPRLSTPGEGWNPHKQFGDGSSMAWVCIVGRLLGSSLVVPPIEELFYRSYLYRVLVRQNFLTMPLGQYHALSFLATSAIFGLMHPDRWVAGIFCGLTYQWLVIRKGRLGDAIMAHAITNCLLGLWIIWRGAWNFW
jgi:uncharacterized protein